MASSDGKLRVAVIGAGDMGNVHAKTWAKVEGVEIVAVSDKNGERAQKYAEKYNIPFWTTINELAYNRPDVDIVSVCIPSWDHSSIVIPALELGKHVMSEKPIARHVDDALRVVKAVNEAKSRGLKYTTSFQRRWLASRKKQAALIQSGVIGRPVMMQTTFLAETRPKIEMHGYNINGGPAIDMGVHQYDYWRTQFNSEPVQVIARGFTYGNTRPYIASIAKKAPDTVTSIVTFASGDIGCMTICWGLPHGWKGKGSPELLIGPKGSISKEGNKLIINGEYGKTETIEAQDEDAELSLKGDEKLAFFMDFIRAIREDKQPWITAEDGLAALSVGVAAIESLEKEGQPVVLNPALWGK